MPPFYSVGQKAMVITRHTPISLGPQIVELVGAGHGSFPAGKTMIQIDLQLFNVFNNSAHDSWQTLIVAPGDPYYPTAYVLPRRLGLRFGISF